VTHHCYAFEKLIKGSHMSFNMVLTHSIKLVTEGNNEVKYDRMASAMSHSHRSHSQSHQCRRIEKE